MSGRGDRGRGRGGGRGRGDGSRGASPVRGAPRGASPSRPRGGGPPGRGGPPPAQAGRGGGRGGPPTQPAVAAPAQGPAKADARISTIDKGVEKFKTVKGTGPEHPLRPGFGTVGKSILLRANFFALKFEKNLVIHEYRVEYSPKTDIARLKGRILELLEQSPQFAQYRPRVAHDKSEKLVSSIELPQPLGIDITFIDEGETTPRANAKQYHLDIVKTAELDTNDLTKHTEGDPANRDLDIGPLVSALNLIVQDSASHNGVRVGKNKYFFDPSQGPLGNGLEGRRGYFASVRPVWKSMMVNINVCMTAFIESKNMAQAIMDFQRGSRGAMPQLTAMFGKSVLRVKTKHLGHRKKVFKIEDKNANQISFPCEELGGTVTVAQYFRKKYPNIPLNNANLPVLNLGSDKKSIWVPAEFCDIVQGLPYRGRLDDRQTSDMLRLATKTPQDNSNLIRGEGFERLALSASSRHDTLKSFGITIDQQMTVIPARVLPPPGLSYAAGRANPQDGSWNILDVKFHRGGNVGRWGVLIVREERPAIPWSGPNDQRMWDFINAFANKCKRAGMVLANEPPFVRPTPVLQPRSDRDPSRAGALQQVKETINILLANNPRPSYLLVILNSRDNYIYPGIKRIGDVELGIHTVCMQLEKAMGRGDPKRQDQYFSNVALKVNTKMGGINHKLDAKDLRWLQEKRTMVVGADVTHPGPTSVDGTPSLAAVVASIDSDFVQFPASMEPQKSRVEMIQNLTGMLIERLLLYQTRNKALPERILYFRDGVSEGQFDTVITEELPQMQEAFKKVYKTASKPKLMICICGKRHHARFYPTDSADATRNGNTKPGTVVDKGIGDVYRFDFYLQAHAGLQGTVKATHYTVVYDEIGFSADVVQQGTHSASYSYVRATKAVSLIPPAYYADLACERGRMYLNDFLNLGAEKSVSGRGRKDRETMKKEVYDECVKAWGSGIHERVKGSMFYI